MITISIWCECIVFQENKNIQQKAHKEKQRHFLYGLFVFLCDIAAL